MSNIWKLLSYISAFTSIYFLISFVITAFTEMKNDPWSVILRVIAFFAFAVLYIVFEQLSRSAYSRELFKRNTKNIIKKSHEYNGYKINIDDQKRVIHLQSRFGRKLIAKTYQFSEIREYGYSYENADAPVILGVQGSNLFNMISYKRQNARNKQGTELYLSVKDPVYPHWRIEFPYDKKNGEMIFKQWMELLNLTINR